MNNLSVVIVSGLSGAGKSTVAKVLEDLDYNTIDNIPLQVVEKIVNLFHSLDVTGSKIAFVIDSRSKNISLAYDIITMLKDRYNACLIFMEASYDTLLNRYKETRRKHPQGEDLVEAIKSEINYMANIKSVADVIFNTDNKSVHILSDEILGYFTDYKDSKLGIIIQSFGFKYGVPSESDIMFDVRFLRNPYFDVNLKNKTGLDIDVQNYVREDQSYKKFIDSLWKLLLFVIPLYAKERKKYLNICIGCTGGHHRSVTVVGELYNLLYNKVNYEIKVKHRDINR